MEDIKLEYNNERYALLENGSLETLYYGNGEPREFYEEDGTWYLDHDTYIPYPYVVKIHHHKIVKFGTKEELKKTMNEILNQKSKEWEEVVNKNGNKN